MHWENDWPVIGVDFDRNGIGEPVYVCQKPIESKTIFAPQTDDDFSTPNLSLQWQFNHNPTDHAWSLSAHPGSLTLKAIEIFNLQTGTQHPDTKDYGEYK